VIRTEDEYRVGLRRLEESKQAITNTRAALLEQGLDAAMIDMLLASMRALQRDVQEEVDAYVDSVLKLVHLSVVRLVPLPRNVPVPPVAVVA